MIIGIGEGVFALLKRGVTGTFHSVSRKHLHRSLSEFEYRWNTRKLDDGARTMRAIQAMTGKRLTYRDQVAGQALQGRGPSQTRRRSYIERTFMISSVPAGADATTLYGGKDPRDLPRYTYPEAARATGVPATTIAAWVRGQEYRRKHDMAFFRPVIQRPGDGRLSFFNLIEVHVLRGLRVKHTVKLETVRKAVTLAEKRFNIPRLLISEQLRFDAGGLFLERYGQLMELTPAEQYAIRDVLIDFLDRIRFGDGGLPRDFFPIERTLSNAGKRLILVSPFVAFGRPIVSRLGVSTHIIADRLNAGETEASVKADYGLEESELKETLAYETAA